MESLGDEPWDVVICGTGLQQSLLALALSRSNKRILHLDPNDYYGEHEAAFSIQEADSWAAAHAEAAGAQEATADDQPVKREAEAEQTTLARKPTIFRNASVWRHPEAAAHGLSFSRAYSLALAPQIIHTRSKLLELLVSSRAYRQVEFLAVGSFFVYDEVPDDTTGSKLSRIPSSREDVFAAQSIPARSKRSLMKFLKFVVDYDSDEQRPVWQGQEDKPLADFLSSEFKLDDNLRKYILALTLALDSKVTVKDGLSTIHRHLTSMGLFGPGFCAVYPKWGGSSEIAQVACRAGAVGGGIYMLDTRMEINKDANEDEITLNLSNGMTVRTPRLVTSQHEVATDAQTITRLVAIVNSPLQTLFEVVVEGAPTPAVAVVAFPSGSITPSGDSSPTASDNPIYALVHSSETGECPAGQSVIYLTTLSTAQSRQRLEAALDALLAAATVPSPGETPTPVPLYKLQYEQSVSAAPEPSTTTTRGNTSTFSFPSAPLTLSFDDGILEAVRDVWKFVTKDDGDGGGAPEEEEEYMVFEDREGVGDEDDVDVYN
ncbi:GDP dissociation inhibitor-domain-containing protein [Xylariaceae sp. FL0662B]|nr:GDP dissociation inhibitor-domain-containing protein [Xylariaceae sp. FL0662B]